jgi:hypothetical protein
LKTATAILFTTAGGSALAAVVLGLLITGNSRDSDLYPGLRLESPSGEYVAEFFGLGGGGAAGWANQNVRVAETGADFDTTSQVVFQSRYGYQVCLRWLNDAGLLVQYPEEAEIEKQLSKIDIGNPAKSVYVEYERRPSRYGKLVDADCSGALATVGGVHGQWVQR